MLSRNLLSTRPRNFLPIVIFIFYLILILKSIYYPTEFEIEKSKNHKAKNNIRDLKSDDNYQISELVTEDEYKDSHPILGCFATLTGALFVGLSFVLQKKGNMTQAELNKLNQKRGKDDQEILVQNPTSTDDNIPVYCKLIWWQGILSLVIGEVLQIVAYKYAPTTLVAPLGAFRVIVSTTLSKYMLDEKVNESTISGIITTILGATLIVFHAPTEEENRDLTETIKNTSNLFNFYFLALILYSLFGAYKVEVLKGQKKLNENASVHPPGPNSSFITSLKSQISFYSIIETCALGGISVMCTKLMTMLKLDVSSLHLGTLFIVFLLIASAPIQIYYVNNALAVDQASKVTPIKFAGTNILIVIGSVLLFNEWAVLSGTDIIGMLCGLLVVICGIRLVVIGN